jgi:hypothetical protein
MRNTVIWSFLSLVALATSGLITGCDSDEKLAKSSLGESCDKTSDCNDGLRCVEGTCYPSSSSSGGTSNEGGEGNGTAGSIVGPKPPVLGGEGETCTKRADCEDGLGCFSGRCQAASGTGGEGSGGPTLGGVGETCGLTSDCSKGLACLPQADGQGFPIPLAIGSNSVGVCAPTDNGLEPTGNVCGGECKTADDCCELPLALHVPYALGTPYGTGANSCTQLDTMLDGVDCALNKDATIQARCFARAAYCECGKTTWTCSDAGRCVYNAACTLSSAAVGGCPTFTRLGLPAATNATCDVKAKKCTPSAAGCKADADCTETTPVAGSGGLEFCTDGKCTCDTESGACYRGCAEDLDCPARSTCDTDTGLCMVGDECETDAYCVTAHNDINSKCVEGVCQPWCNTDLDCNDGFLTNGQATQVCNAGHVCEAVGCESDTECGTPGGVRSFCLPAPEPVATGTVVNAVTD